MDRVDPQSSYNDEYYEQVDKFDWITEAQYWVEKDVPDGYIHTQLRVTNKYGEFILKIDEEGLMITCTCGCIDSYDTNFTDICSVEKEAKKLRNRESYYDSFGNDDQVIRGWMQIGDNVTPPDSIEINELTRLFKELQSMNPNKETRLNSQLRSMSRSLERIKRNIEDIDDETQREEFLEKLRNVLDEE